MRWGAVIAGAALAVGLWVLLQTLGMGIGLAAIDTDDAGSVRGASIGTGVWSIVAPLIAIFVGAMIAARLAGTRDLRVGGMHGAVVWAVTSLLGLFATISLVSMLASGAVRAAGVAADATADLVGADEVRRAPSGRSLEDRIERAGAPRVDDALVAADRTGKVMLFAGLGLLLSLIAATGGGMLGARRTRDEAQRIDREREPVTVVTVPPPPPPVD